jgi:PAS domain S-box-containing protein
MSLETFASDLAFTPVAAMAVDRQFSFTFWNGEASRLLGFDTSEALGRIPFDLFMPESDIEMAAGYFAEMLRGKVRGRSLHRSYIAYHKDGHALQTEWCHQLIRDDRGSATGVVALAASADACTATAMQSAADRLALDLAEEQRQRLQRWSRWNELLRARLGEPARDVGALGSLTVREQELVMALAEGKRIKTVAREMDVSTHTARNHLKSVFRKLEVHSQEVLIQRLRELLGN